MAEERLSVLFLCTGNSARSQMAEALLRHLSRNRIDVSSAGSTPQSEIHPMARTTLESKFGIDTNDLHPKSLGQFLDHSSTTSSLSATVPQRAAQRSRAIRSAFIGALKTPQLSSTPKRAAMLLSKLPRDW